MAKVAPINQIFIIDWGVFLLVEPFDCKHNWHASAIHVFLIITRESSDEVVIETVSKKTFRA
jgi:hypothetical protein